MLCGEDIIAYYARPSMGEVIEEVGRFPPLESADRIPTVAGNHTVKNSGSLLLMPSLYYSCSKNEVIVPFPTCVGANWYYACCTVKTLSLSSNHSTQPPPYIHIHNINKGQ